MHGRKAETITRLKVHNSVDVIAWTLIDFGVLLHDVAQWFPNFCFQRSK